MRSMTGFGRGEITLGNTQYTIEIKTVNHRYLDTRFRLPSALSPLELPMTELLRKHLDRGSVEVSVRQKIPMGVQSISGVSRFVVDEAAAKSLEEGLALISKRLNTPLPLTTEAILLSNRVMVSLEDSLDPQTIWPDLKGAFLNALADLTKMREAEGSRLLKLVDEALKEITRLTDAVSQSAPDQGKRIGEKLKQRIAQWNLTTSPTSIDAQRLEWEVALFAERADITEEIDRLRLHVKEFDKLAQLDGPVGRKLDFMTQELHRESNTIGSKTTLIEITQHVVNLKATIEKLREQVQNVE